MFARTRRGSLVAPDEGAFRFVPDTAQSLFLEYGTAKHTTYAAQCALCHRATNGGGQAPSGVRMLSRFAEPKSITAITVPCRRACSISASRVTVSP